MTQETQNKLNELLAVKAALKLYRRELEKYNEKAIDVCTPAELKIIRESLTVKHETTTKLITENDKQINTLINGNG